MHRFIIICFFCLLFLQPVYSQTSPISDLNMLEQSLGIKSVETGILPRLDAMETILFGHTVQDNIENRIARIKSSLNPEKSLFNYSYDTNVGDYYQGSSKKWTKFPVTVNINNVPDEYKVTVANAVNKWKAYFPFEISNDPKSDVDIVWVNKFANRSDKEETLGQVTYNLDGTHKCKIEILNKHKYLPSQAEEIILHELGHVIGLGHSPNPGDIMYKISRAKKGRINQWSVLVVGYIPVILPSGYQQATPGNIIISQRDINTILRIYTDSSNNGFYPVNFVNNASNNQTAQIPAAKTNNYQDAIEHYMVLADDYYYKGNYDLAIQAYKKVIEISPNYNNAYVNIGNCYNRLSQYDQAIPYLNKALAINPNDQITYNNIGLSYKAKGLYKQAIENFQKAVSINPNFSGAHCNLGSVYIDVGNYDLSITSSKKAIEINPNDPTAYNNLGAAYEHKGLYDQAVSFYEKALSIDPNYSIAKRNLANTTRRQIRK